MKSKARRPFAHHCPFRPLLRAALANSTEGVPARLLLGSYIHTPVLTERAECALWNSRVRGISLYVSCCELFSLVFRLYPQNTQRSRLLPAVERSALRLPIPDRYARSVLTNTYSVFLLFLLCTCVSVWLCPQDTCIFNLLDFPITQALRCYQITCCYQTLKLLSPYKKKLLSF